VFLEEYSKNLKKKVAGFSDSAMEWLNRYDWPGNIRELKNVIERAVIVSDGPTINTRHLSIDSNGKTPADSPVPPVIPEEGVDLNEIVDRVSTDLISKALAQSGGNRSKAARLLSIPRQVLLYQMKKLGMDR
jgi:DNA-binding NtrC family response regulator